MNASEWPCRMAVAPEGPRVAAITTTFVDALRLRGFIAPWLLDGAVNRDAFEPYLAKLLMTRFGARDVGARAPRILAFR